MRPLLVLVALVAAAALLPLAGAVHWYRGATGGCTEADGALLDPGVTPPGPVGATVMMLHNSYHDLATGSPVTVIRAGESVTWRWASLHCHSAVGGAPFVPSVVRTFYSGYHYPSEEGLVRGVPGFFEYPVPSLAPELSYTHTFMAPGHYPYYCEHHALIGMVGLVIVQDA